jgi:hydroxymethylbilane synthase
VPLRIGTRGSPMALYQAGLVRDRLYAAHPGLAAELVAELVPIRTTGDRVLNRRLAEIGGKGLFTKEIEEALFDRRIDLAVHSLKDMETVLPAGLELGAVLARDDPRDALVAHSGGALADLPQHAAISKSCRSAAMSGPGSPSSPPASSMRWSWPSAASNASGRPPSQAKSSRRR